MDVWWQCEIPYPFVPQEVLAAANSVRGSLPNKWCDPKISADLFHEVLDEFLLCDDEGMNVLAIEHHAGINSLMGSNPMFVGILARQTHKVRILSLGTLVSLRKDPVRIAEEYATADVMSRGRLEIGFVKSGGTEMASNHTNPVGNLERYWEAIDLIKKALSHHEGPFSWEGKYFTHRHVNIWPRPWQQPHPRMWSATGDPPTAAEAGRRGMVHVLVLRGPDGTKRAYQAHRRARAEAGFRRSPPTISPTPRWSMSARPRKKAAKSAASCCGSSTPSLKSAPQLSKFLPGTVPPEFAPQVYRTVPRTAPLAQPDMVNAEKGVAPASQNAAKLMSITTEEAMQQGILFAGNPDSVYRQIMEFYDKVGGFGHLAMIGRSGFMTHEESVKGIKLFSREVAPRLREIKPMVAE